MMNLTTACWVIKMVNARNIGVSNHQVSAYAALPEDIYYVQRGTTLILLLCGGDKSTQNADIKQAHKLAKETK
jgi:putative addiction module killer protein